MKKIVIIVSFIINLLNASNTEKNFLWRLSSNPDIQNICTVAEYVLPIIRGTILGENVSVYTQNSESGVGVLFLFSAAALFLVYNSRCTPEYETSQELRNILNRSPSSNLSLYRSSENSKMEVENNLNSLSTHLKLQSCIETLEHSAKQRNTYDFLRRTLLSLTSGITAHTITKNMHHACYTEVGIFSSLTCYEAYKRNKLCSNVHLYFNPPSPLVRQKHLDAIILDLIKE